MCVLVGFIIQKIVLAIGLIESGAITLSMLTKSNYSLYIYIND